MGSRYAQYSTLEPDLIELVRYRDDVYGDIQTDGSVRLRHRHTLAYALVHKNVEVPFHSAMHSSRHHRHRSAYATTWT